MPNSADASTFEFTAIMREIGRGKEGARGLTTTQAEQLFSALLAGQLSPMQVGAVLIALRVKGESADELVGFMQAIAQQTLPSLGCAQGLEAQSQANNKPVVVIPSYNGARRRPNFTPLLACLLARQGFPVLVHGLAHDATGRVTSGQVFNALLPLLQQQVLLPHLPVFADIQQANPPLASLLKAREALGVRNCAHTLVKFWVPAFQGPSVLITSYTHPEFWHLQRQVLSRLGQTALVLRGHEGEPVSSPHKAPRMDGVKQGQTWCLHEGDEVFSDVVSQYPDISAPATAELIVSMLNGHTPVPKGVLAQIEALSQVVHATV